MIRKSTLVAHGTAPAGKVITTTVPLRSRFPGDTNPISSFRFRGIGMTQIDPSTGTKTSHSRVSAIGGTVDGEAVSLTVGAKRRPPLMHSDGGLTILGGTGGVAFGNLSSTQTSADLSQVGTLVMLVKPISSTFRVSLGTSILTMTASGGGYTVSDTGTGSQISAIYINGRVWSGVEVFPFPRLVTVVYIAGVKPPIRFGNPSTSGTPNSGQVMYFGTTERILSATDVGVHASMFYRRPKGGGVLTDPVSALSAAPADAVVTNPASWVTV